MYFLKFLIYFKMFIIVEIFNIFVETDKKIIQENVTNKKLKLTVFI